MYFMENVVFFSPSVQGHYRNSLNSHTHAKEGENLQSYPNISDSVAIFTLFLCTINLYISPPPVGIMCIFKNIAGIITYFHSLRYIVVFVFFTDASDLCS